MEKLVNCKCGLLIQKSFLYRLIRRRQCCGKKITVLAALRGGVKGVFGNLTEPDIQLAASAKRIYML